MARWKKRWIWLAVGLAVVVGIGTTIVMGFQAVANKRQAYMVRVVESDEAKAQFEVTLMHADPHALTPAGIIKTYRIQRETIRRNPMGGINVVLEINQQEDLTIEFTLNRIEDHLEAGGTTTSGALATLLEAGPAK